MKLFKLALVVCATMALILPAGGCSSKSEYQEPKVSGPDDPNLKRAGRGVGGEPAKPAGPASQAPVSKN